MITIKKRIINLFGLVEIVKKIYDGRGKNAQIPGGAVFLTMFFGMLTHFHKLNGNVRENGTSIFQFWNEG